jgi:uncharacterized membrane protein
MSSILSTVQKPKVACAATLLLVFLCGGLAGAVVTKVGQKRLYAAGTPLWTASGKAIYLEKVKRDLSLSPQQTEQMETILDDFAQYYRTVLTDGKARILQILDDEQRTKFEQMIQESQR